MPETKLLMNQILEEKALSFPEKALRVIVEDPLSLQKANEFIHAVKELAKEIIGFFKPLKEKAKAAHQALVDREKSLLFPLEQAENMVKPKIASYLAEQRRIQREAEEKVRQAEAERKRIEDEKLAAAIEAENTGQTEEAEKILDEIVEEPKPDLKALIPQAPKPEGIRVKKIPKWRVINLKEVPRDMFILDNAKITWLVKASKGQIQISGIEIYFVDELAIH